ETLPEYAIAKMSPERAVAYLENELQVSPKGSSEIIEISLTGDDGAAAAAIVNAVAQAYLDVSQVEEREQRAAQLEAYLKIQANYSRELTEKHREFLKAKDLLDAIDRAQQRFHDVTAKLELAQLQLQYLRENKKAKTKIEPSPLLIEEEMGKDDELKMLRREKLRLESFIDGYKGVAVPGSELERIALKGYSYDLAQTERKIAARREEIRPRIIADLQGSISQPPELDLPKAAGQVDLLKLEKQSAQGKLDELENQVIKTYGKKSDELRVLALQAQAHEKVAPDFAKAIEGLKLRVDSPSRMSLLQAAVAPPPADPHRQSKTVALASIGAFLFVGFCTAWFEFRARRIHAADELVRELRMRLLGTLPAIPERLRTRPQLIDSSADHRLQSALTESTDGIRAMLMHESRQQPIHALMITSAVGCEGKTTLASQLALNFAHTGHKTLLIDGDFLKPMVSNLFEVPNMPGTCEVLRGDIEPGRAVAKAKVNNLTLLPAGKYDRRVSQAIARGDFQKMLDQLKQQFEFIIIDSCPVLSVANTLLLGQHVDAVVLAVLRDRSQVPRVYAAYQRLAALGIRVVGAVFNKVRSDMYGYYGYYGSHAQPEQQEKAPA
ncbi:MAG: polysaccharide biosynthesis tyrosine autokinase, partial [Gemmataceae bacterium]